MIVALLTIQIHMQGITSLKEKRRIVKSLIERLKSRFNASVAEVDGQDNKNNAVVGIGIVSNNTRFVNQQLDTVINFICRDGRFYVGGIEREVFSQCN